MLNRFGLDIDRFLSWLDMAEHALVAAFLFVGAVVVVVTITPVWLVFAGLRFLCRRAR